MNDLWQDLRYACRTLAQRPGFTAVVVLTLGLGIGANTAIFSVVDTVLLTPLPYKDPDRLVMVRETTRVGSRLPLAPGEFLHLRQETRTLSDLAAFDMVDFNLADDTGAERVAGAMVSAGFFSLLGVDPAVGRFFSPEEAAPGENRVAVISHGLWQRRFGGDRGVLGRELRMSWNASFGPLRSLGESFTVVGVLPPGFLSPMDDRDVYLPLALTEANVAGANHYLFPFGRLAPGATEEEARAELAGLLRATVVESGGEQHGGEPDVYLVGLTERAVSRTRSGLLVLWAAVGLVLLIACTNVAHLVMVRDASRERELALRTALGASRLRLARQLGVESLVLAVAGGLAGLGLGYGGVALLRAFEPGTLPRVEEISIDASVLLFTAAVTLVTAAAFGLLPAWGTVTRFQLAEALRDGLGSTSGGHRPLRSALAVLEVALAVVLVAGAGLLFRSFLRLQEVDLGFRTQNLLGFEISLPRSKYDNGDKRAAFYREAQERIAALPGVSSVGLVRTLPLSLLNTATGFTIEGRDEGPGEVLSAAMRACGAGYFETLGIPLLAGESLTEQHVEDQARVVVVNRSLARTYWGEDDPLGERILLQGSTDPLRVIGIVGDVHQVGPERDVRPTLYFPSLASPSMAFAVRTEVDPDLLVERLRREIAAIDPGQPIHHVSTLERMADGWVARPRFHTALMSAFAALALLLAALGIYGVLAFSISCRTREMGVRMALGARRADVLRLVLGQGMRLVAAGLLLGVAAALALGRFLESLLFEVTPRDPLSLAGTVTVLLAVALFAIFVPARRATRVDPITALRHD